MAKDSIGDRYSKKLDERKLSDLAKRARSKDDIEAEEKLIEDTDKVEPIKADQTAGRNDPCPCGSGKKYKKCCWGK